MTYVSFQSLTNPMRQSIQQIQAGLTQATSEESTLKKADIGLSLGGQTGTALSLQSEIDNLNSFKNTNALASTRLSSTSNALATLVSSVQNMSEIVTGSTGIGSTSTLQTSAAGALQNLIGTLNTTTGGQFIFGGINTDAQPVNNYTSTSAAKTATDNAFQTYLTTNGLTASTLTGAQMQTFLNGPFAALFNDANWSSNWSNASSRQIQTTISPSQSITTSVSANDPSIRLVAQAYSMLSEFTGTGLSSEANSAVLASAGQFLSSGLTALNNAASGVGVEQTTLDAANTQIDSQVTLLTSNVSDLEGVDPAALSTQITQLQTQLQASYKMTSELSQLSLVNYLT